MMKRSSRIVAGIILVGVLALMMLVLPVSAHFPPQPHVCDNDHPTGTCLDGKVCGVTVEGHWGECQACPVECTGGWHGPIDGPCPEGLPECSCKQERDHPWQSYHHHLKTVEYDCHHGQGWQSCGSGQEQHWVSDQYGCLCPQGKTDCDGTCVNLQIDPANCGACGDACSIEGSTCSAGQCVPPQGYCDEQIPCGSGYTCTDHQCVEIPGYCDEDSDCQTGYLCGDDNQCYDPCADVQCEGGEVCVMGNCVPQTCEVDEDCGEGYVCTDGTCQPYVAPEEVQSRGQGRYQNSYWSEVGECDKALLDAEPGPVLPTNGNGNILIQAKSCIPNSGPAGGLLGCTQMDGLKAFWRRKVDSVNDPRCQFLAYFGGCDGEASNGGFPETIRANNPQDVLRVIGCRPENQGDGPIIYFTLSKGDKILMENSTLDDPKATCLDISYDIPAYCGECRVSENLAAIWHMEWIAPLDSPIWDVCPVEP